MKKLTIFLLLIFTFQGYQYAAAQAPRYAALDIIKVKNRLWNEAVYFFENNWKVYREDAIKKCIITSYQMLVNKADSVSNNIVLITVYPDSLHYRKSEENFHPILKQIRPGGPVYLNEKLRNDFIETLAFNWYRVWINDNEKIK